MPTRDSQIEMISNQMLKGLNSILPEISEREKFRKKHEKEIEWVMKRLPRCSAAVGGVLTKFSIKYGQESIISFCDALKNKNFNGPNDPAYMLWIFLQKHRGNNTKIVYQKTLCAIRAYHNNKKIKTLTCHKEDI